LPLPKEQLTLSVTCAFKFKRAEYLDAAPLANAPGNMPSEGFERRVNLPRGDVSPQNALVTAGLYSLSGR
jgi:hypothetical protein